jgi:tryptophan synthase alpha chain
MPSEPRALLEARLREASAVRCAFIPFVTAGDPDPDTSLAVIERLARHADAIEIGIPYSDPLADGPVIQAGSLRALESGMNLPRSLDLLRAARKKTDVPLIAFTYVNPVFQYGPDRFAAVCREAGANGVIVPDLPLEESGPLSAACDREGIALIPLIALTSRERVARIAASARGFAYCVSSLGVTGERSRFSEELQAFVQSVRAASRVPVAVGFGISSPEHVRDLAEFADGVIVGSALVRRCGDIGDALRRGSRQEASDRLDALESFVSELRDAGLRGRKGRA